VASIETTTAWSFEPDFADDDDEVEPDMPLVLPVEDDVPDVLVVSVVPAGAAAFCLVLVALRSLELLMAVLELAMSDAVLPPERFWPVVDE